LLGIVINGKVLAEATCEQHEIEDCRGRLDCRDVHSKVEQIVDRLTHPVAQSPQQRV
jgi:hypothetical protein